MNVSLHEYNPLHGAVTWIETNIRARMHGGSDTRCELIRFSAQKSINAYGDALANAVAARGTDKEEIYQVQFETCADWFATVAGLCGVVTHAQRPLGKQVDALVDAANALSRTMRQIEWLGIRTEETARARCATLVAYLDEFGAALAVVDAAACDLEPLGD